MSKSDENANSYIALLDEPDVIRAKIRRAVTDSDGEIRFDKDEKPGVSNLLGIYAACKGLSLEETEAAFKGMNYGALKEGVTDAVLSELVPLQQRYQEIRKDKALLNQVMAEGAEKAAQNAYKVLRKVQKKVGFGLRKL